MNIWDDHFCNAFQFIFLYKKHPTDWQRNIQHNCSHLCTNHFMSDRQKYVTIYMQLQKEMHIMYVRLENQQTTGIIYLGMKRIIGGWWFQQQQNLICTRPSSIIDQNKIRSVLTQMVRKHASEVYVFGLDYHLSTELQISESSKHWNNKTKQ